MRQGGEALPKGVQALLMTQEECSDTLEGGGSRPPVTKTQKKTDEELPATTKATAGSLPSVKNNDHRRVRNAEPSVPYCEPTSSRIKVEDLVTDDKETQNTTPALDARHRSFWDRPIPKPQFEWAYDPHMPTEWNEMISAMRAPHDIWPQPRRER